MAQLLKQLRVRVKESACRMTTAGAVECGYLLRAYELSPLLSGRVRQMKPLDLARYAHFCSTDADFEVLKKSLATALPDMRPAELATLYTAFVFEPLREWRGVDTSAGDTGAGDTTTSVTGPSETARIRAALECFSVGRRLRRLTLVRDRELLKEPVAVAEDELENSGVLDHVGDNIALQKKCLELEGRAAGGGGSGKRALLETPVLLQVLNKMIVSRVAEFALPDLAKILGHKQLVGASEEFSAAVVDAALPKLRADLVAAEGEVVDAEEEEKGGKDADGVNNISDVFGAAESSDHVVEKRLSEASGGAVAEDKELDEEDVWDDQEQPGEDYARAERTLQVLSSLRAGGMVSATSSASSDKSCSGGDENQNLRTTVQEILTILLRSDDASPLVFTSPQAARLFCLTAELLNDTLTRERILNVEAADAYIGIAIETLRNRIGPFKDLDIARITELSVGVLDVLETTSSRRTGEHGGGGADDADSCRGERELRKLLLNPAFVDELCLALDTRRYDLGPVYEEEVVQQLLPALRRAAGGFVPGSRAGVWGRAENDV